MAVLAVSPYQLDVPRLRVGILAEQGDRGGVEVAEVPIDPLKHAGPQRYGAVHRPGFALRQLVQGPSQTVVGEMLRQDLVTEQHAGGGVLVKLRHPIQRGPARQDIEHQRLDTLPRRKAAPPRIPRDHLIDGLRQPNRPTDVQQYGQGPKDATLHALCFHDGEIRRAAIQFLVLVGVNFLLVRN